MKSFQRLSVFGAIIAATVSCGEKDPEPVNVSEVILNKVELTLPEGESEALTATVLPKNSRDKVVTWHSSDGTVATVDGDGMVTAVASGSATVTAMAGGKTATCLVTVNPRLIDSGQTGPLQWRLMSDGILTIGGNGAMPDYTGMEEVPWARYNDLIGKVVVEEGVTTLGSYAFYKCQMAEISLPETLTAFGNNAFTDSYLESITIPSGVTQIGSSPFYFCRRLARIDVEENNEHYASIEGVLFNKSMETILRYPAAKPEESYTMPDGSIEAYSLSFSLCTYLKRLTVPNSVTNIHSNAITNCSRLESIEVLPGNPVYNSVDGVLFGNIKDPQPEYFLINYPIGKSDSHYTIPEGVTVIGSWAFDAYNNLESVTIPSSVTKLYYSSFYVCTKLRSVTIMATTPPMIAIGNFDGVIDDTLFVPQGCVDAYNATAWKESFATITEQP